MDAFAAPALVRHGACPPGGSMREETAVEDTHTVGGRARRLFLTFLAYLAFASPLRAAERKTVVATGYCPCADCCGPNSPAAGGHGLTASGERPHPGITVAADWSLFPPGTRLFIQNIGHRIVQDRGRDIVGPRIDIFFRSHAEAVTFGRRSLRVHVIR